jgi:hypothetical protein
MQTKVKEFYLRRDTNGGELYKTILQKQEKRTVHECQVFVYYWTVLYIKADQKVKPCLLKKKVETVYKY